MDVGHASVLGLLDEGRSADVVPHLPAAHGEDEAERDQAPRVLVVEELEVVPAQVEQAGDEGEEHEEGDGAGVVGRAEDADVDVGALVDPLADGVGAEAHALHVQGVGLLRLALGGEVHEHRRGVELHDLEAETFFKVWQITIQIKISITFFKQGKGQRRNFRS